MYNILLIGADVSAVTDIGIALQKRGYNCNLTSSATEGLRTHREDGADIILVILPLPNSSGAQLIARLKTQDPRSIIVVCGKDEEVKGAIEALELGAFEYLSDPFQDINELLSIIGVSVGARKNDAELRYLRKKDAAMADWRTIVGQSPPMRQVFSIVRQICHRTTHCAAPAILITGETGTGKGLLAKAIHYNSIRRSGAFVEINCAALPQSLIEAELFGHTKGAFTDARSSRAGLFETAEGGTLFLDEVGAIPPELQTKLLTAIEDKCIRRLGSSDEIHVDVQVITATNRDLVKMVEHQTFRDDLYHRLSVITIVLPPLRERGDDVILLAQEFIRLTCGEYGLPSKQLSLPACEAMLKYTWPGNVRELRNCIERIVLLADNKVIKDTDFQFQFSPSRPDVKVALNSGGGISVDLPEQGCPLESLEREVIRQALQKHQGNVTHTARYLRISRRTLIYRLAKHQLG
jgi:two-component system, NtrC family, response regulator AtoC